MTLRRWQSNCVTRALDSYRWKRHFLCLATPGAGKTTMAAELAARLLASGKIDFVLCFAPSVTVSLGLRNTFQCRLGKRLDGRIGAAGGTYTYQGMRTLEDDFWSIFDSHRVLVVFDEIHHCAGSDQGGVNSWGQQILVRIQRRAEFTLALTGTPWRSDKRPIVLAEYSSPCGEIQCDYIYGLQEAIENGVCRKPIITLIDNEQIVLKKAEENSLFSGLDELFSNSDVRYEQLLYNPEALRFCLSLACTQLDKLRVTNPNAGGLVVASSVAHAEMISEILRNDFQKSASTVTYQHNNPSMIIDAYRQSSQEWIVSVGMISEGTDIPRLQVCCHLSRITTELYFRQVLGRILRITERCGSQAWLYSFAEPQLVEFALRIQQEIPEAHALNFERPLANRQKPLNTTSWLDRSERNDTAEASLDREPELLIQGLQARASTGLLSDQMFSLELGSFRQRLVDMVL